MTIGELIELLQGFPQESFVRFSVDDEDTDPDDGYRVFCESGVAEAFEQGGEVTICLSGCSNIQREKS